MPFIDLAAFPPLDLAPGVRLRAPFGENLMLSHVELDAGAVVPPHHHPHEQGGYIIAGRVEFTIGDETRVCGPGDLYLMCSDGLSDMLDDEAIAQLMQSGDSLAATCQSLIDAANDAGGKDNISVILARASGGASPSSRSWWPFRRQERT